MQKKTIMIILLTLLFATSAFAVEAHWEFGTPAPDGAVGYYLEWGTVAGTYTTGQDILKTACVSGTDTAGAYDCKLAVVNTAFTIDVKYYFRVRSWKYEDDGINHKYSLSGATAEFIRRTPGTTGGNPPRDPTGLGLYETPQ